MRAVLFIAGAAIEFVGIVLVASPDLFPYAARMSEWLARQYRRIVDPLRRWLVRLFRRDREGISHVVGGGGVTTVGGAVTGRAWVTEDASLEEKVRFLLARHDDTQRVIDDLGRRLAEVEGSIDPKLATLEASMTDHVSESLDRAHREYRALRLVGVAFLVVGLGCVTVANFV